MKKLTFAVTAICVISGYNLCNLCFAQIDYTVTAPYTSPTRNTCGAIDNCTSLFSEDHLYQVTIPVNGLWTFHYAAVHPMIPGWKLEQVSAPMI